MPNKQNSIFIQLRLIVLTSFLSIYSLHAQQPFFHRLTKENGLVSNRVQAICQDKNGYIWIGTQTGLQRYDGSHFTTYVANMYDSTALQNDWITSIFEDSKGRLWVGTAREAPYIFDRVAGTFENVGHLTEDHNKKIKGVWQFFEDKENNIWIVCSNGFYKLNSATNRFESKNKLLKMSDTVSHGGISMDTSGDLWFTTIEGIKELEMQTQKVFSRENNPYHLAVFDIKETPENIFFGKDSNMWVSTGYKYKLYRFDLLHNHLRPYSFEKPGTKKSDDALHLEMIGPVFISSSGKVVIPLLERSSLAVYDGIKDKFFIEEATPGKPYKVYTDGFSGMYMKEDKENNIWIGTNDGISLFSLAKPHFITYGSNDTKPTVNTSGKPVSGLIQIPGGDILTSYYCLNGGLIRLDKNLNFKHQYLYKGNGRLNSISNQLWNLFMDNTGIIWASNQNADVLRFDIKTGEFKKLNEGLLKGYINDMKQDAGNNFWIAHWSKGLVKIDNKIQITNSFTGFINPQNENSKRAICLLQDNTKIWVGTFENGLQVFNKNAQKFTESFVRDEKDKTSISNNTVMSLLPYNKDTLIIATEGGINIFDKNKKTFKAITSKDGLPNNLAIAMVIDDNKNLWAAFEGGFCRINMRNCAVTNYGINDGINENSFNGNFLRLNDGRLAIGSAKGFLIFDPKSVLETTIPPDVTITSFTTLQDLINTDIVTNTRKPISLSYLNNNIRIEFASIYFNRQSKIRYFYQLEGVDKEWIGTDNENEVHYNQLRPGNYTFKIKCSNRDGIFCKRITTLQIRIIPPFWKTWWFGICVAALCVVGIFMLISWREKNIKTLETGKTRVQQLMAEQYKIQFEAEQISSYFSTSLLNKNDTEDVLWDVAKNLIGKMGFADCMIYLWNHDKTKLIQKAGYGPKDSLEEIAKQLFDVLPGQGVVGYVAEHKKAVLIPDTSQDARYRADEMVRYSEICVPIMWNDLLIGVIDSEHPERNFFTQRHLQLLTTISEMVATKINVLESEKALRLKKLELASINQQLTEVQLTALRSQMNPHFIFNALNSIKTFVMENDARNAEKYLDKFAKLIRFILDTTQSSMVFLDKEIELLTLYLDLEQLRFSDKLSYSIGVDERINAASVMIPSMLIQPFVENAILHGILHRESDGFVSVRFIHHAAWLEIIIDDNGVGREKSELYRNKSRPGHRSLSMEITNKRLRGLKKDEVTPAGILIADLENSQRECIGTRVSINVPI